MSYFHDDDGSDEETVNYAKNVLFWTVFILALAVGIVLLIGAATGAQQPKSMIIGGCDETLWSHTYHAQRLVVSERCASVTGTIVDATHGKNKDGCRHEADGDGHCFLKLDAGQERYINAMNLKNEGGNLVFEPECRYRVKQEDAKEACKNWKQKLVLPPVGSHVRITGAAVLDTQHGHRELHPVSSIEVVK